MPPSSAWTSASRIIAPPPRIHDTTAAGPAIVDALSAPKSHPEPMIEPTDVKRSPTNPMSRRSRWLVPVCVSRPERTLTLSLATRVSSPSLRPGRAGAQGRSEGRRRGAPRACPGDSPEGQATDRAGAASYERFVTASPRAAQASKARRSAGRDVRGRREATRPRRADHPVLAGALRLVERGVGRRDDGVRIAPGGDRADPEA